MIEGVILTCVLLLDTVCTSNKIALEYKLEFIEIENTTRYHQAVIGNEITIPNSAKIKASLKLVTTASRRESAEMVGSSEALMLDIKSKKNVGGKLQICYEYYCYDYTSSLTGVMGLVLWKWSLASVI